MQPDQFKAWRRSLGLKQKDAAEVLGLKKRMIQYYEKGDRDGRPVEIPKSVRLACFALLQGIGDFNGEQIEPLIMPSSDNKSDILNNIVEKNHRETQ
ncbi:helix-turn-helix domain-containing protein [Polycladidibacter stylochi]|uniref:helix-turn-helix domain-containing protein n=1 Tax=Polycladidibacter stylochi TaxID=1807766 RepID=UPI00082B28B9|nr:helix-turn-helix transcriptional regulator [Pseudovibrio stylochi]